MEGSNPTMPQDDITQQIPSGHFLASLARLRARGRDFQLDSDAAHLLPIVDAIVATANAPCFVPMRHLWGLLKTVRGMVERLGDVNFSSSPTTCLVTGPEGVGISTLLSRIARPEVLKTIHGSLPPPRLKCLVLYTSLRSRVGTEHQTLFFPWLVQRILQQVEGETTDGIIRLRGFLMYLLERSNTPWDLTTSDVPTAAKQNRTTETPWATESFMRKVERISDPSYLKFLDKALVEAGLSILVLIDEFDAAFQALHFSEPAAASWIVGLMELIKSSTMGFILSTSLPNPDRLLFTSVSRELKLPPKYTHISFTGSFDRFDLRKSLRISLPCWTAESLADFILLHSLSLRKVVESFTSPQADAEAARLDSLFAAHNDASSGQRLQTQELTLFGPFLAEYGHSLQNVLTGLADIRCWQSFGAAVSSRAAVQTQAPAGMSVFIGAGSWGVASVDVLYIFGAYLHFLWQNRESFPANCCFFKQLDCDPALFEVDSDRLFGTKATFATNAAHAAQMPGDIPAKEITRLRSCLDTALDLGVFLQIKTRVISIRDPSVFLHLFNIYGARTGHHWLCHCRTRGTERPPNRTCLRRTPDEPSAVSHPADSQHLLVAQTSKAVFDRSELEALPTAQPVATAGTTMHGCGFGGAACILQSAEQTAAAHEGDKRRAHFIEGFLHASDEPQGVSEQWCTLDKRCRRYGAPLPLAEDEDDDVEQYIFVDMSAPEPHISTLAPDEAASGVGQSKE